MTTRVRQKKRGQAKRKQAKIILIGAEGNNKTEKYYFSSFNRSRGEYIVHMARGNDTDPVKIVRSVCDSIKKEELDFANGDLAFCTVDTDTDIAKQGQIDEAIKIAHDNNIELILSNPCFEIWFLMHFTYSTKYYPSTTAVTNELEKFIPEYRKSRNVFDKVSPHTETAKQNAINLEQHHADAGHKEKSMECNPSSEAYKIVEKLFCK